MRLPTHIQLLSALATVTSLALANQARADQNTAQGEVQQLDRFVVEGLPVDQSTNPLTREVSSVLGDNRNVLLTPRGVTTLTTALFNERQIHGVRDVVAYSPSAYAGASYGKTTVPNLRGDTAETYLNGQRLSYNLYGYFPSFNGVEAIDLVRGPGSAVFGAGYFSGGYVNYVTKQPNFNASSTSVTTRIGTWSPSETSFLNGSAQLDTTAPLSKTTAYRISYEAKTGDTFWKKNKVKDDRQDLFAAFSWRPSAQTTLDLNAQFMWQASPEVLGINRITQELIDNDIYYSGDSANDYTPGAVPTNKPVVLPWDATLFSKTDYSNAKIGRFQATLTHEVSDGLKLVNRSLYEHVDRHRVHAFEYLEYAKQDTAENRTELHGTWSFLGQTQRTILGGTVRYEGRESYVNYYNEYFYNWDITNPSRVFDQASTFYNSYWPGDVGPDGHLFFGSTYDSPETVRSETWNPAAFLQQDLALSDKLSAIVGLRAESFWARARDPLPPAGGPYYRDAELVSTHSQAYSLVYRLRNNLTAYATHNRIHAANGNVCGGGVILNVPNGQINRNDFRNLSELFEAGLKASLLDNKLFAAADWFQQERSRVSFKGKKNNIIIRGVELETTFQPSKRLSLTANATFQDGHYVQSAPYQMGGRDIYAAFTSTGSYDPWGNQVPVGDWPLLGFSKTMLNGSLRYQWDNGFGLGFNPSWQSKQIGNLDNQWHIPAQVLYNANAFYECGRWLFNIDFLNVTNERNWIHNGDAYTASQLISRELPFRMEGYVKYRF